MNKKLIGIWAFVFVVVEQGIKLVINQKYLDANFPIWTPWLYFDPLFNRDYSWVNSMLQLGVGKWVHIVMVIAVLVFIYLFFLYFTKKFKITSLIGITFSLFFAGAICSLIDKLFWDGSLDYVLVKGFFTFDLKDAYLNIAIALILFMFALDHQGLRTMD